MVAVLSTKMVRLIKSITGMLSKGGKWGKGCRESGGERLTRALRYKIKHFIHLRR